MKKRDILLLLGGVLIVGVLWLAPAETTKRVPADDSHNRFYEIVKKDGKKAAEKFCQDCHNKDGIPFTKKHPGKNRCLLCHKLTK